MDKGKAYKNIETNFKHIKKIKAEYELRITERKINSQTGGRGGKARISDPTAMTALFHLHTIPLKEIAIYIRDRRKKRTIQWIVKNPHLWLRLYEDIEKAISRDYYKKIIFASRYKNKETREETIAKLNINPVTYNNIKNEILFISLAGACQYRLIKII